MSINFLKDINVRNIFNDKPVFKPKKSTSQDNIPQVKTDLSVKKDSQNVNLESQNKKDLESSVKFENGETIISDNNSPKSFYINGILTSKKSAVDQNETLSEMFNTDVELLYNESDGLIKDVLESTKNLFNVDTKVSQQTASKFKETLDSGQKVKVFAHSQGAAITADALKKVERSYFEMGLSSDEVKVKMSNVEVISIGGFATNESFPDGVKVDFIENKTDHIPKFAQDIQNIYLSKSKKGFVKNLGKAIGNIGSFIATNTSQAIGKISEVIFTDKTVGELTESAVDAVSGKKSIDQYMSSTSNCLGSVCKDTASLFGKVGNAMISDHLLLSDEGYKDQLETKAILSIDEQRSYDMA